MSNPVPAFKNTFCDSCGKDIDEDDDVFLTDDGKLCTECAEENDYVCECGQYKKAEYSQCWECARS